MAISTFQKLPPQTMTAMQFCIARLLLPRISKIFTALIPFEESYQSSVQKCAHCCQMRWTVSEDCYDLDKHFVRREPRLDIQPTAFALCLTGKQYLLRMEI